MWNHRFVFALLVVGLELLLVSCRLPSIKFAAPLSRTAAIAECLDPSYSFTQSSPDLAMFKWENFELNEQIARKLQSVPYPIYPFSASPDGRWLMVGIDLPYKGAVAVLDTQGDENWWVNSNTLVLPEIPIPTTAWLPDGQLLWVDELHAVRLGIGDDAITLNAPLPILEIYPAAEGMAFAIGQDQNNRDTLWRVDLATDKWEAVELPREEGWLETISVARDGTYAVARGGMRLPDASRDYTALLWRISTTIGDVQILPSFPVNFPQIDGNMEMWVDAYPPRDSHVGDSSYWIIEVEDMLIEHEGKAHLTGNVMMDISDGHLVTAAELGLEAIYYLTDYSVSPDGNWLKVDVYRDAAPIKRVGFYIAPTTDLTSGQLLRERTFEGWHTTEAAFTIGGGSEGRYAVSSLMVPDYSDYEPMVNSSNPLISIPNGYLTGSVFAQNELLSFALDGTPQSSFNLAAIADVVTDGYAQGDRVWVATISAPQGNHCDYGIVEMSQ